MFGKPFCLVSAKNLCFNIFLLHEKWFSRYFSHTCENCSVKGLKKEKKAQNKKLRNNFFLFFGFYRELGKQQAIRCQYFDNFDTEGPSVEGPKY